jgi:polar amino acid transport system ATP-binding protein
MTLTPPENSPEKAEAMIRFGAVRKSYGDRVVLDDLDFAVARGEKIAIIGPSGSGKTTILRIVMTLVRPDAGSVLIDGVPLWQEDRRGRLVPAGEGHLRRMRSNIGMVFQQFNLFPHLSVLENVTEALIRVQRKPKDEAQAIALETLDMVGLKERAPAKPWQLSGGQQQRVAIARAIALKPDILLFDEVTSALDPELVGDVLSVLRDLAHHSNTTMLFVTHEMRFARDVSDRVVMFDHGAVVEQGEPAQIFGAPHEERTRQFLRAIQED